MLAPSTFGSYIHTHVLGIQVCPAPKCAQPAWPAVLFLSFLLLSGVGVGQHPLQLQASCLNHFMAGLSFWAACCIMQQHSKGITARSLFSLAVIPALGSYLLANSLFFLARSASKPASGGQGLLFRGPGGSRSLCHVGGWLDTVNYLADFSLALELLVQGTSARSTDLHGIWRRHAVMLLHQP